MELKFINNEEIKNPPKSINYMLSDLRGKLQFIMENNKLLKSLNIK